MRRRVSYVDPSFWIGKLNMHVRFWISNLVVVVKICYLRLCALFLDTAISIPTLGDDEQ
jgi:hypothetical protein